MKKEISNELYEQALEVAEKTRGMNKYDEVEVVLVPYVICRKDGYVEKIIKCNVSDIE